MDEIKQGLVSACKAALPHFTNPNSLVAHQLRAAIEMAELGHVPHRPLPPLPDVDPKVLRSEAQAIRLEQALPECLRGVM